jgi:HAD superfamily hydrolase (TIGR01490 family)
MPADPIPTAAIFDFDGTLTVRDTSLAFLRFTARRRSRRASGGRLGTPRSLPWAGPALLLDGANALRRSGDPFEPDTVLGRWERRAHERLTRRGLAGLEWNEVRALGEAFAAERLPAFARHGGAARVRWHRARGDVCVLVSASLDVYLKPWGERAGFHHVAGTELEVDDDGRVSGAFRGAYCWGLEKVRRVQSFLGPLEGWRLHVYGDGPGDRHLLERAHEALRVRRATDLTPRRDGRR